LIWGYVEGECYFLGLLLLVVEGIFVEVVVLVMLLLSIFNYDCVVVVVVSWMMVVVGEWLCIEMGFWCIYEWVVVVVVCVVYVGGFVMM